METIRVILVAKKMTRSYTKSLQNYGWFCDRQRTCSAL
jgi:hypothetical protein